MISRNVTRLAATHGLALLLGLAGYVLVRSSESQSAHETVEIFSSDERTPRGRSRSYERLSSNESLRATWQKLASHPMSAGERRQLREELLQEWGKSDPQGLLAFLEKKHVWPDEFSFISGLGSLAEDRPDILLDFTIRNGAEDALHPLAYADPATIVRLIEALPPGDRGDGILKLATEAYQKLGKAGAKVATPTAAYFEGDAEALLEEGRLDEFCEVFEKIDDDDLRDEAADKLGDALSDGELDEQALETLAKLPTKFQEIAVSRLFNVSSHSMKFPEVREERRQAITTLIESGLAAGAESGVMDLFSEDDRENVNRETVAWLKDFPPDDSWKEIKTAMFSSWAGFDSEAMVEKIAKMPVDAERDRFAEGAVKGMRSNGIADDDRPRLARLMSLISDPAVRQQFEEEDASPSAPFADPFAE